MFLLFIASTVYYHQVILLKSTNYNILRYQNTATDNTYINKDNIIMNTRQQKTKQNKINDEKASCPFTFPLMFEVYFIFQTNFSSSLYPIARALGLSLLHLTFVKMICTVHCWVYEFHIEITDESFSQGSNEKDESDSHGRLRRAPFCNETPHSLNLFAFSWNCWNEFLVLVQFAKIISLIC